MEIRYDIVEYYDKSCKKANISLRGKQLAVGTRKVAMDYELRVGAEEMARIELEKNGVVLDKLQLSQLLKHNYALLAPIKDVNGKYPNIIVLHSVRQKVIAYFIENARTRKSKRTDFGNGDKLIDTARKIALDILTNHNISLSERELWKFTYFTKAPLDSVKDSKGNGIETSLLQTIRKKILRYFSANGKEFDIKFGNDDVYINMKVLTKTAAKIAHSAMKEKYGIDLRKKEIDKLIKFRFPPLDTVVDRKGNNIDINLLQEVREKVVDYYREYGKFEVRMERLQTKKKD